MAELNKKEAHRQIPGIPDESANKQAFFDKKEFDREIRKLENQIKRVESSIENLENEITAFERKIADPALDPESVKTHGFYDSYDKLRAELTRHMTLWEQLHNDLEHLKNKRI